jgi:hypothetical protein
MSRLTPAELGQLRRGVRTKIRKHLDAIDHETRTLGERWYPTAHNEARLMAETYGVPVDTAAAVIAVLSPRLRWSANLAAAWSVFEGETPRNALERSHRKARAIVDHGDLDQVRGPKVTRFRRNISDPQGSRDVTLDTWMIKAIVPERWTFGYSDPYKFVERVGVYDAIQAVMQSEASAIGMMPHGLQASIWIHVRGGAG